MSNTIKLKRSGVSSQIPSSLEYGELAINYADGKMFYKNSSGTIASFILSSSSGSSIIASDTAPTESLTSGDLWFESSTGKTFIYYDSFWVEIGSSGSVNIDSISGLSDVALSTLSDGDFLRYNSSGSVWTNDPVNLGTDTVGNYMSGVSAGTGISVSHTPSEGSTATVSIDATLDNLSNVTVPSPTSGDFLRWNGTAWVNDTIDLGTDTTGNYVAALVAGTGISLANNSGEGATPTISIGQSVGTSSSVQFAGIRNTDFSNFGLNSFTKATVGAGEIAIDNGTTDTPGLLMYYANNNNWGIDSSPINGSQSLRFVTNLNETGGTVRASIDANGNMVASTFRGTDAGSVLKDTMLDNSQVTVVSTTAGSTGSMVNFITYNYTPVSSSSYLIVHIHISKYTMAGTTDDSWYSQINVDGSEIAYGWQMVNDNGQGTSGRSGVLFPLTGRYTNSNTTAKTIGIAARRDSADDSISIDNSSTAIWLRITEVAR